VVTLLVAAGASMEVLSKEGRTPLLEAARSGRAGVIRILAQNGANVHATDKDGKNAFHLVRGKQDTDSITALLDLGVNLVARDERDCTPLHAAMWDSDESKAKLLLKHGANPQAVDNDGELPIVGATCAGNIAMMKLLFESGIDINHRGKTLRTLLFPAIITRKEQAVRFLLSQKDFDLNARDNEGRTALMEAVQSAWGEPIVQILVEQPGLDVDIADNKGRTALTFAPSPTIARLLLSHTNMPSQEHAKYLAGVELHYAALSGDAEEVRRLLKEGIIDPNTQDREGVTPLMKASFHNHQGVVEALLECTSVVVDLEEEYPGKDYPKMTMLYYTCFQDWESMTRLLLSAGSKMNQEDGRRILRWAARHNHEELARLALGIGADPNGRDDDTKAAPLHIAATRSTIYSRLLNHGADPSLAWKSVESLNTPLSLAASNGHVDCVESLLANSAKDDRSENWLELAKLYKAAREGDEVTGLEILERGSIATTWKDEAGCTLLHLAAENGCVNLIRLLLQRDDSTINWQNERKDTPILHASRKQPYGKRSEVLRELLKHPGVDLNFQSDEKTALMLAAKNGDEDSVRLLLEHGASVEIKDGWGNMAANYGLGSGNRRVIEILRDAERAVGCGERDDC
jgi:ankyrin repeat protein